MTFNAYEIIRRAVEEGTAHGVRRCLEHLSDCAIARQAIARQETFKEYVEQEIMNALCEVIDFSHGEEHIP